MKLTESDIVRSFQIKKVQAYKDVGDKLSWRTRISVKTFFEEQVYSIEARDALVYFIFKD